jgi:hypothetical protein
LSYPLTFIAGAAAGIALLALVLSFTDDSDAKIPAVTCTFPPYDAGAYVAGPAVTAGQGAVALSAQARTVIGESVVEVHTKVCFKSGSTLETGGTGVIVNNGAPWRVLTAAHVVDARQWEAVESVEVTVRRAGSFSSNFEPAKVTKIAQDADIADLEVQLEDGVVWQSSTVPASEAGARQGDTLAFLCFYERSFRSGVVINTVSRAGGVPAHELNVGSGLGCSGAGAITPDGALAGIVIQSNSDVTRVSDIAGLR